MFTSAGYPLLPKASSTFGAFRGSHVNSTGEADTDLTVRAVPIHTVGPVPTDCTGFGETLISHTSPLVSRDPLRLISKQSSTEVRESAESECTHISIMKKEKGEANFQRSPEVLSLRMCISIRGRLECRRDCDM